ncbi:anti-sigma factor [Roseovarius sp. ZX-A-9]|uniref:anti-sigma factor n=1 Tax=Roseovarius sp. ZX-A-9 TaxID=3014783 RepID=UPI00232B2972|nr:anti-sigma factor [Roseovarius sp. ZX-A-9]MDX1785691.1 anti-sigma factor [Roseovarius sp.]
MTDGRQPYDEDDRILAGEYALGLLTPEEATRFEARLVQEPELRALYAAWAEDFVGMTDGIAEVTPPPNLLSRIEARIFGAAAKPSLMQRLGLGWVSGSLAAAAVAVVIGLNAGLFDTGPSAPADPAYVAQIAAEDGSLIVQAAYDADNGELYLRRDVGGAASGRALELWLIAGDNAPVSLGVLPETQAGSLTIPEGLRAQLAGGVLAISDEPPGGSPTGVATGAVLAIGPVSPT